MRGNRWSFTFYHIPYRLANFRNTATTVLLHTKISLA